MHVTTCQILTSMRQCDAIAEEQSKCTLSIQLDGKPVPLILIIALDGAAAAIRMIHRIVDELDPGGTRRWLRRSGTGGGRS